MVIITLIDQLLNDGLQLKDKTALADLVSPSQDTILRGAFVLWATLAGDQHHDHKNAQSPHFPQVK